MIDLDKKKNILFLDMDGVLNNNYLIRKWCDTKFLELQEENQHLSYDKIYNLVDIEFKKEFKCSKELIFSELANRLNEVIIQCNLKLIWSSTWRNVSPYRENINNARAMLERHGIIGQSLIGYTPNFGRLSYGGYNCRINEILAFIKNNTYNITFNDNIGAIDDLNLFDLEKNNIKFFQTEVEFGLTEKIKNDMIKYYS